MVMMRDVWVNWFEGEENGDNVCPFHEWRSEDRIEVLDQVKLLKVDEKLMDYIEDQLLDLPTELLKEVFQKSYLRKNMSRIQLDYCFIATDGKKISRLQLRENQYESFTDIPSLVYSKKQTFWIVRLKKT